MVSTMSDLPGALEQVMERQRRTPFAILNNCHTILNKEISLVLLNPGQKIGKTRLERIVTEVAPLACRGATCEEISQKLGISISMAKKDLAAAFEIWHQRYFDDAERWRPLMVARYEMLFREAFTGWEASKECGRPNAKLLDSATRTLGDLAKMLGLALDLSVVQTNIQIGPTDTATALAPLTADDYLSLLESGNLAQLNTVPPIAAGAHS